MLSMSNYVVSNKNDIQIKFITDISRLSPSEKNILSTEMHALTKETWGDPGELANRWLSLSDVVVEVRRGSLIGFATCSVLDDNIFLFPATIIHPNEQGKKLGLYINKLLLKKIFSKKLNTVGWCVWKYFEPWYIVFRTPNPRLYASVSKRINIYPSLDKKPIPRKVLAVAERIAKVFSPEREFNRENFVIKNALMDFPGLIYATDAIPWSGDDAVDSFFREDMELLGKCGNELVIVGQVPKLQLLIKTLFAG